MLSVEVLNKIGKLFNGDTHQIYPEKKGYELVEFFNKNFGFNDEYRKGFPSKWFYTQSRLEELDKQDRLHQFFNIILNRKYIMRELGIGRLDTITMIEETYNILNEYLYLDDFKLVKKEDKYTIVHIDEDLELVGSGGFADVYMQNSTGVIVKKLKDESIIKESIRSRFKREFNITKSIGDLEHVIDVYDFNENEYSYTMELADKTLWETIKENELSENKKIEYIETIISTMKQIHDRDIIHRDISPNNILIVKDILKISDFGLGKDMTQIHSHQTIHTNNYGQYDYCAPEQRELLAEGDKRSDVFSVGKVINFILAGNPNISNHFLRSAVNKAISIDPQDRYKDVSKLHENVKRLIEIHKNGLEKEIVYEKINQGIFDEEIKQYLYQIDKRELNNSIKDNINFVNCIYEFIESDPGYAKYIINLIHQNYDDICKRYEEYDNFAKLSDKVLRGNAEFEVKEIAAKILSYVAWNINRFDSQRWIEALIVSGIEPMLEDILEN